MFLGRVPAEKVQTRASWEFLCGASSDGAPVWTADITQKIPVLTDTRLLYPVMFGPDWPALPAGDCAGRVTYTSFAKYIFASWSCSTTNSMKQVSPGVPGIIFSPPTSARFV